MGSTGRWKRSSHSDLIKLACHSEKAWQSVFWLAGIRSAGALPGCYWQVDPNFLMLPVFATWTLLINKGIKGSIIEILQDTSCILFLLRRTPIEERQNPKYSNHSDTQDTMYLSSMQYRGSTFRGTNNSRNDILYRGLHAVQALLDNSSVCYVRSCGGIKRTVGRSADRNLISEYHLI